MKVCVAGLWHLGSVTAAYLASLGIDVVGFDPDSAVVEGLKKGQAPLFEPGLNELLQTGIVSGRLSFTGHPENAVRGCSIVWITFDTPVQWDDHADIGLLKKHILVLLKKVDVGTSFILSSQVPVGFCKTIEKLIQHHRPGDDIVLSCSPENLRLGKALDIMRNPDRIVVGVRRDIDKKRFAPFFSALSGNIQWMSTESAEMTKHAINAFLATSVVFANELAVLCEAVGANAREVSAGLLSESRIGPQAYLKPGSAFAGGTLARDVQFLIRLGKNSHLPNVLMEAVLRSNRRHQNWIRQKITQRFKRIKGRTIAVFGLTYKPDTDTLRRSWAIELCRWLHQRGARVQAFDPLIKELPRALSTIITLKSSQSETLRNSDCAVITVNHSSLQSIGLEEVRLMASPLVLDPNGVLAHRLIHNAVDYCAVGYESRKCSQ